LPVVNWWRLRHNNQTLLCEVPVFQILMAGDISSKKKMKLYLVKYSKHDWSINSLLCEFYIHWTVHHCDSCASACNTDTTPTQPHRNSNTHRTKNDTTNEVIQQNSRKLLMMDILMSETCLAHKKWNNIASDIKLVFYSSTSLLCIKHFVFAL